MEGAACRHGRLPPRPPAAANPTTAACRSRHLVPSAPLAPPCPLLDSHAPAVATQGYIDFEIEQGEHERTRDLYRQLLERTSHPKVWVSFAKFEYGAHEGIAGAEAAAAVYGEAEGERRRTRPLSQPAPRLPHRREPPLLLRPRSRAPAPSLAEHFRTSQLKEERVLVLTSWKEMEEETGDAERIELVTKRLPKRIKKKRALEDESGEAAGWEEYFDYIFPEEEAKAPSLKILEMARAWKKQKTEPAEDAED